MNNFKKEDVVKAAMEKETAEKSAAQGYSKIFEQDSDDDDLTKNFSKKAKYESKWSKDKKIRDDQKQTQSAAITTAQTVGWREPYDNLTFGNARVGIMKRTFNDNGHL